MADDDAAPTTYPIPDDLLPLFMDGDRFIPDMWWWGFNTFVTQLVALAAQKIRDGCGYPCRHPNPNDVKCECKDEWYAYLDGIRDDLNGYDKFAWHATPEQYERVQDAMHRFVNRMGAWWD